MDLKQQVWVSCDPERRDLIHQWQMETPEGDRNMNIGSPERESRDSHEGA